MSTLTNINDSNNTEEFDFLTFDYIFKVFPDDFIKSIIHTIDLKAISVVLIGLDDEKSKRIIDMLSKTKRAMLNHNLSAELLSEKEVSDAKKYFVNSAIEFHNSGVFDINEFIDN